MSNPIKTKTIDLNTYLIWDYYPYLNKEQLEILPQKVLKDLYFEYDTLLDCFFEKELSLRQCPEEQFGLELAIQMCRNIRILLKSEPSGLLGCGFHSNIITIDLGE